MKPNSLSLDLLNDTEHFRNDPKEQISTMSCRLEINHALAVKF